MADENGRALGWEEVTTGQTAQSNQQRQNENAITPSMARERESETPSPANARPDSPSVDVGVDRAQTTGAEPKAQKAKASLTIGDVPEEVAGRYLSETRGGSRGFYPDAQSKEAAFLDGGNKLSAERTDPNVISDMLKVTEHRGWEKLEVSGTSEFRREVWIQGQARGVGVTGYKPTERDLQELDRWQQGRALKTGGEVRQRDAEGVAREAKAERPLAGTGVTGKLLEVGEAPYQDRRGAKPSPYVKLEVEGGQTRTLWGVGLPDVIQRAGVEKGDTVTVKREGFEQVTKQVMVRDGETGKPVRDAGSSKPQYEEKSVNRGLWTATADKFLNADKATRVSDPALKGPDSQLRVVESYVDKRVDDPATRDRLMTSAKDEIARGLASGARYADAKVHSFHRDTKAVEKTALERQKKPDAQQGREAAKRLIERQQPTVDDMAKMVQQRIVTERRDPERERSR